MTALQILIVLSSVILVLLVVLLVYTYPRKSTNKRLDEIHLLVNSQLTAVVERVDQLTQLLEAANVEIPPDPAADRVAIRQHTGKADKK